MLNEYRGLLETLLTMKSLGPMEVFSERFEAVLSPLIVNRRANQKRVGFAGGLFTWLRFGVELQPRPNRAHH